MMLRQVRVLARPEVIDALRNRRLLIVRALTPLAFLIVVAGITSTTEPTLEAEDRFTVAVEGDLDGAASTLERIEQPATLGGVDAPRLDFEPTDDAGLAIAHDADVGLVVPDDLDRALADGDDVTVTMHTKAEDRPSRASASLLRAALFEELRPLGDPLALDVAGVEYRSDDAATDDVRIALAAGLATLVLLQGGVLIGTAASRLTGRRAGGALVPQLLLPVARRDLVAARTASEVVLGLLTAIPLVGLVTVIAAVYLLLDGDLATALLTLVLTPVAMVATALPLVTAGIAMGVRARSVQQVSALTAVGLVIVALGARFVAGAVTEGPALLAAIPILGPPLALARTVAGDGDPVAWVVALASTAVAAVVIGAAAVRLLRGEHLALRDG
jgi:hypothetical protein